MSAHSKQHVGRGTLSVEAKRLKDSLVKEYAIVDTAGLAILDSAMESFDDMRAAEKLIAKHGVLVTDRFGALKQNPAHALLRGARIDYLRAMRILNFAAEPPASKKTRGGHP